MPKSAKAIVASFATIFLTAAALTSATPAQAANTLSLAQWNVTQGAIDLHAAMDKSDAIYASVTGLSLVTRVDESGSSIGYSTTENIHIDTTRTSSHAQYAIVDNDTQDHNNFDYYFANGSYIESVDCFQSGVQYVTDLNQTLKRLGKPNATAVNDHSSTKLEGLPDIAPSVLLSNSTRDPLGNVAGSGYVLTYSEVTKAADLSTPTSTVFTWTGAFTLKTAPITIDLTASETFNADGLLTAMTITEHAPNSLYDLSYSVTASLSPNLVINTPVAGDMVDAAALITMGHKLDAEKSLTKKANSIVAKAKALAKAAKTALSAKHLTAAATALKVKFKSVKNGAKLTAVVSKVSGSLCITAAKGKAAIAPCN